MRSTLHQPGGVEQIVHNLIPNCAKEGHHGLDKCTPKELEVIMQRLLAPGSKFEEKAKANFPRL